MNPLIPLFVKDEQDEAFDLEEEIKELAEVVGWQNVLKETFGVLGRDNQKDFWHKAVSIIYWAVTDQIPLPVSLEECAARLYCCLELFPGLGGTVLEDGDNLVWSVVSKLKGVSYESSWNPLNDLNINIMLARLRSVG
jgi:hypothetical protein